MKTVKYPELLEWVRERGEVRRTDIRRHFGPRFPSGSLSPMLVRLVNDGRLKRRESGDHNPNGQPIYIFSLAAEKPTPSNYLDMPQWFHDNLYEVMRRFITEPLSTTNDEVVL